MTDEEGRVRRLRPPPVHTEARQEMLWRVDQGRVTRRRLPEARNRYEWRCDAEPVSTTERLALVYLMSDGLIRPAGESPEFLMAVTEVRGRNALSAWSAGER